MNAAFDPLVPDSVEGVLERFAEILAWSRQNKSRLGYFPALYRGVTLRAQGALSSGDFENPAAAERLVVLFAGRYFEALSANRRAPPATRSWQTAFAAAERWAPTVSQHLLLGINAHINLDLGIAAAHALAETGLPKSDFDRVNGMLVEMIDEVESKLARVWPLLRLFDWAAGRLDEKLIGAGLRHMRSEAWDFARALSVPGADTAAQIEARDLYVARAARFVERPGVLLRLGLGLVRLGELRSTTSVIDLLDTVEGSSATG